MSKKSEHTIVFQVPPTKDGSYRRTDANGRDVRGDASGEWMLNEHGDPEDIVFFASPSFLRKQSQ